LIKKIDTALYIFYGIANKMSRKMLEYQQDLESENEDTHGEEVAPEPYEECTGDDYNNYPDEIAAEPIDDYVRGRYQDSEASDSDEAVRPREYKLKIYYRRNPNTKLLIDPSIFNEISGQVKIMRPYENSVKVHSVKLNQDNSVVIKVYDTDTYYKHSIHKKIIILNDQDCMVEFEEDI